ncbi:SlyX family protein [Geobacter sp.]|uniref:SlyX family protein n=1 Tax=Geobacter sp. TaxID=46610 RepID=UPI002627AEF7|nr:SlyX family protein [Geobacter sp.]
MQDRLTDLEIHIAHLERTVQELNEVVFRQQRSIDRLEGELKGLREQFLAEGASLLKKPEEEEPPPHY